MGGNPPGKSLMPAKNYERGRLQIVEKRFLHLREDDSVKIIKSNLHIVFRIGVFVCGLLSVKI